MYDEGFLKPKKIVETWSTEPFVKNKNYPNNCYEVNEWGLPKKMCECSGKPRFLQEAQRIPAPASLPRQTPARIVELSDDAVPPSRSTKLEIVEVDTSNEVDNFYKPKKCVVIDKRTTKTVVNGNLNCLNSEKKLLISGLSQGSSSGSGDSGMGEDLDINPLLGNTSKPLPQTNL